MASVLETFFILFESDAEDVKTGSEEAGKSVDDLDDGIKRTDSSSVQLGKGFADLAGTAAAAFASIFAVTSLISQSAEIIDRTDQLNKFSQAIGENIEDIDAWSEAIVRAGGDAAGFQGSLKSLNEKIVETSLKGTSEILPFFNQLGISMVDARGRARSTLDILPELADAFQNLTQGESLGIGQRLGLDESTILLLQSGRHEVEKLVDRQRRLGVTTQEQADIIAKAVDQWSDFKQQQAAAGRSILINFLPAITDGLKLVEQFTFYLQDNEDLVTGFFIAVGTAITAFALPALISLGTWVLVVASPFLLMAAAIGVAIAAIALLWDEYQTFLKGGDTLFGELLDRFPAFAKANSMITKGLNKTLEVIKAIYNTFLDLIGLGKGESIFKTLFNGAKSLITGGEEEETTPEPFDKDIQNGIKTGKMMIADAGASPVGAMSSNAIANSVKSSSNKTTVNTGDIIIQPKGNTSAAILAEVGSKLGEKIKIAVDSFDDGVEV